MFVKNVVAAVVVLVSGIGDVHSAKFTGKESCRALLSGSAQTKDYKVWNTQKSSTRYKVLLDHSKKTPHFLRMGMAVINDNLLSHQHRESEIYYYLRGEGTTYLGPPGSEMEVPVRAGTFLYIPEGVSHYTVANENNPLELIYIFPRNGVQDIEYLFDGSLPSFEKDILVGNIAALSEVPNGIHRETVIGGVDLFFERIVVPKGENDIQKAATNTILFANEGRGTVTVNNKKVVVEKWGYLLISKGHDYLIENEGERKFEVFLFGRKPE